MTGTLGDAKFHAMTEGTKEDWMAIDHPQAFPDAVAKHEPAVEDRHGGLRPGLQRAVDPDPDRGIARVVVEIVDAL